MKSLSLGGNENCKEVKNAPLTRCSQKIGCSRNSEESATRHYRKERDPNLEDLVKIATLWQGAEQALQSSGTEVSEYMRQGVHEANPQPVAEDDGGTPDEHNIWRLWQYGLWSFQTGSTKLERFLPKNQHTQRKLLNFENWCNGEVSKKCQNLTFKVNFLCQ